MPADTLSLTLTFEPLPVTTQKFDFTSPDGLQLLNIRNADCLPDGITDTYWRSEQTGEWLMGITPHHVIYHNKVWDIVIISYFLYHLPMPTFIRAHLFLYERNSFY